MEDNFERTSRDQQETSLTSPAMTADANLADPESAGLINNHRMRGEQTAVVFIPSVQLPTTRQGGINPEPARSDARPVVTPPVVVAQETSLPSTERSTQPRSINSTQIVERTPATVAGRINVLMTRLDQSDEVDRHYIYRQLAQFGEHAAAMMIQSGRMDRCMNDLQSSRYNVRVGAEELLLAMGPQAFPYLYSAQANPSSTEQFSRVQRILNRSSDALVERVGQTCHLPFEIRDNQGTIIARCANRCLEISDHNGQLRQRRVFTDQGALFGSADYDTVGNITMVSWRGRTFVSTSEDVDITFSRTPDRRRLRRFGVNGEFPLNAVSLQPNGELRIQFPDSSDVWGYLPNGTLNTYRPNGQVIVTPPGRFPPLRR